MAEGNPPDALLIREVVRTEQLPLDIHIVSDGEKAIEYIARADTETDVPCPDILLLDLNLPKKDGYEVLERLRASPKCKEIPVVIVTSSDSPADRSRAAEMGAGFFHKPPSYTEYLKLGAVLRNLLKDPGAT